jgi:cytosine/adenosine deaminase-related metal-dependent hydrolase
MILCGRLHEDCVLTFLWHPAVQTEKSKLKSNSHFRAGLINTHHHMFQALTRCIAQDQKLFGWLKAMYAGWQHVKVRLCLD